MHKARRGLKLIVVRSWFASSDHVELLDHAEFFADHAEL